MKNLPFYIASSLLITTFPSIADGQFYAKLNVNAQLSDEGDGSFTEIRSNNSWIGVKGDYELESGLDVVYRLEWKVDVTGEDGVDTLTERPQYVGLRGSLGELTLGRNFTALWMAQGKIDQFNHYEGDIKALFKGENRLSDVATYISPSFNNFHIAATYQAEKSEDGDSAVSAGLFYGDRNLKSTPLFAALAHDFDVKGYDVTRASAQYKFGSSKIGVIAQWQEPADTANSEQEFGAVVSYEYKTGQYVWRTQYQDVEDNSLLNLGVDYMFGANTKMYTWVSNGNRQNEEDRRYIALGFEHKLSYSF